MPKSFSSNTSRSAVSDRRNFANSPCGSSTTWKNCSYDMPSRSSTARATSSIRVIPSPSQPSSQVSEHFAGWVVKPPPRFFGRSNSGERTIRNRRDCTVSSSDTSVGTSGSAYSQRSFFTSPRAPGTRPNRANATASSNVVLPAPVSPCSRNSPSAPSESKSTVSGRG